MQYYKIQLFLNKSLFIFLNKFDKPLIKSKKIFFKKKNPKKNYFLSFNINFFSFIENLFIKQFNGNLNFQKIMHFEKNKRINFFMNNYEFLDDYLKTKNSDYKLLILNQENEILNLNLNNKFYQKGNSIKFKIFLIKNYFSKKKIISGHIIEEVSLVNNISYYQNIIEIINYISLKNFDFKKKRKILYMPLKNYEDKTIINVELIKLFILKLIKKIFLIQKIEQYNFKGKWKTMILKKNFMYEINNESNLADPFIMSYNKKNYIFAEEFNLNEKGVISCYEIKTDSYLKYSNILKNNKHMSFPFVFKNSNNFYLSPETSQFRDIRIYKNIKFPKKWILKKIIVKNIDAVDNIIFYKNNLWWLITSTRLGVNCNYQNYLLIFYAKDLFSNKWSEHKLNPIYFEKKNARNGGFMQEKSNIYRVTQEFKKNFYGYKININKILRIDKSQFKERKVSEINPNFNFLKKNKFLGIHHLNKKKNFYVFDVFKKDDNK
jgi:hypothetical protein